MGKFGLGFGLIPYSSVGYKLQSSNQENMLQYKYSQRNEALDHTLFHGPPEIASLLIENEEEPSNNNTFSCLISNTINSNKWFN